MFLLPKSKWGRDQIEPLQDPSILSLLGLNSFKQNLRGSITFFTLSRCYVEWSGMLNYGTASVLLYEENTETRANSGCNCIMAYDPTGGFSKLLRVSILLSKLRGAQNSKNLFTVVRRIRFGKGQSEFARTE